jgi:hypothetical protein
VFQQTSDALVFEPRISEAFLPSCGVPAGAKTPVNRPPGAIRLVVAADVVAEEVVSEEHVTAAAMNLSGLGQFDVGVAGGLSERLGPAGSKKRGVGEVRAGPDPEVAAIVGQLIGEQKPSKEGEGPRCLLTRGVAIDVGPTGPVRIRGDVEGYLGLVERHVYAALADQVVRESEDAVVAVERVEEGRRLIRGPPVEVGADMSVRRRSFGDQSVDLVVQDVERVGRDDAGDDERASGREGTDLVGGEHGDHRTDTSTTDTSTTSGGG